MIPKIIHHVWIDPGNQSADVSTIPPDIQDNLRSWQSLEAGYRQKIWLAADILTISKSQQKPEVGQAFRACRFPSMQADIARLLFLYIFGGLPTSSGP